MSCLSCEEVYCQELKQKQYVSILVCFFCIVCGTVRSFRSYFTRAKIRSLAHGLLLHSEESSFGLWTLLPYLTPHNFHLFLLSWSQVKLYKEVFTCNCYLVVICKEIFTCNCSLVVIYKEVLPQLLFGGDV